MKQILETGRLPKISVIVTTYNWPEALSAVLNALSDQTFQNFEILVADDGSSHETTDLINIYKKKISVPLIHIWQEDLGFRASTIRNKAIIAARGEYIIFLDGDCIPLPNFVATHALLSESGFFVVGNRILLRRPLTEKILSENINVHKWSFLQWCKVRFSGQCNRIFSLIPSPDFSYSGMFSIFRKLRKKRWQGAKTCNLGVWKSDLMRVNGFEEEFVGWGYEDSDLVIRLIRTDVKRKGGRFGLPVIHLWHPEQDRSRQSQNWEMLCRRQMLHPQIFCNKGLDQYTEMVGIRD